MTRFSCTAIRAGGRSAVQLDFLPPLGPAAAFWARLPPLPGPLLRLLWLLPPLWECLPPLRDASGLLAIAAARDLLMPCFRRPSYCLSSLTLGPWSLAIVYLLCSTRQPRTQPLFALLGALPALALGATEEVREL